MVQCEGAFRGLCEPIITEAQVPVHERMPKQVRYQRSCGCLCQNSTPQRVLKWQTNLSKASKMTNGYLGAWPPP